MYRLPYVCLIAVLFLAGCEKKEAERLGEDEELSVPRSSFSFSVGNAPYDLLSKYYIQPGDVLDVLYQIQTWKKKDTFSLQVDHTIGVSFVDAPELNQVQPVMPNGFISLPYIGKYYVVDKTVDEIQAELVAHYKNILRDPDIYVTVPEFRTAIRELKNDLHTAPRGLSRLVTVRPDGYVTFPMVGEVQVASRSITEVNAELNENYDKLIAGLHVDLFLEKHSGSLVYVLGEVYRPGAYQIIKPITVAQGLILAQGYRPSAKLSQIVVVRKHEKEMVARIIDLKKSAVLGGRGGLFYLQPDDIVYVPQRRISKWADVMIDLREIIFFRGWNISLSHDPWRVDNTDEPDESDNQEDP